ncbi:polygalacturonase-like [Cucurbita pepo subsp. pepo]|uniref:polygalacturonase-like n=1 Tax=Cucurbita pepo subsp. pepo TaxID=3664 RepID=UPI000C9D2C0A|nr:polygalacturonase-like [Cucurbita pepo subsp. pepo]
MQENDHYVYYNIVVKVATPNGCLASTATRECSSDQKGVQKVCKPTGGPYSHYKLWTNVGSLGKSADEPGVKNVTVTSSTFVGTTNGVRIKSWGRPSNGFATNIHFQHIILDNVENPIIIDQNYCPHDQGCPGQDSGVKISEVTYEDIKGTSATEIGVNFDCSPTNPCTGLSLENIKVTYNNQTAKASCKDAKGTASGVVEPPSCLE